MYMDKMGIVYLQFISGMKNKELRRFWKAKNKKLQQLKVARKSEMSETKYFRRDLLDKQDL
jgi:hypothetical protein